MKEKRENFINKILKFLNEDKFYIIAILVIVVLFNIKLPYYVSAPGGVIDVKNRIEYDEKIDKQDGSLNMLYVTEYVASIPFYLLSYVIKDWDLESIENSQISNEGVQEINMRNKIMLDNSIHSAMYVAYKEAEHDVEIINQKYYIIGTIIENNLKIGDEILEIEGKKVTSLNIIKEEINNHQIGDKLKVLIKRKNKEQNLEIELKEVDEQKALGVVIVENYELKTNPEIELKFKQSESGSSGGLMMALSIYNAISGEDILKGRDIAGTGTIDREGNVGEIGGIKYKIMGAAKNKMDIVLVPSANYKEALEVKKEKGYSLKIIEIKTFKDAVTYLKNSK